MKRQSDRPEAGTRRTVPFPSRRLSVLKTYKLFIGGGFPLSESGRYDKIRDPRGVTLANVCRASRKDLREAVTAARSASEEWSATSPYRRALTLYRTAEILEGRRAQFVDELEQQGIGAEQAEREVLLAIDRWVHYAGWADKYQQIFSSVNPVSSSHFAFSLLEPVGVVGIVTPNELPLLGLVSLLAPVIAGGNTAVLLASEERPLSALTLGEVLHSSELPAGVTNILSGRRYELIGELASHRDLDAVVYGGNDPRERERIEREAALSVKRVSLHSGVDWLEESNQGPYLIRDCQEVKSTWHPIGA